MDYSFFVIGSDKRMKFVYRYLYEKGHDVCFADEENFPVWDYQNIILIAPPKPDYDRVRGMMETGCVHSFFGGALDTCFYELASRTKVQIYDYLNDPEVVWENAVLTAKGIVAETLKNNSADKLKNSIILGYGNCGKALAEKLVCAGITIAVRRTDLRDEIEAGGYNYINLSELSQFFRLAEYSYIYNTIPAMVLGKELIDSLKPGTVIYDIASAPGGIDFDYCKEKRIEAHLEPGIPGRCYPDEAGRIIADYVGRIIYQI